MLFYLYNGKDKNYPQNRSLNNETKLSAFAENIINLTTRRNSTKKNISGNVDDKEIKQKCRIGSFVNFSYRNFTHIYSIK